MNPYTTHTIRIAIRIFIVEPKRTDAVPVLAAENTRQRNYTETSLSLVWLVGRSNFYIECVSLLQWARVHSLTTILFEMLHNYYRCLSSANSNKTHYLRLFWLDCRICTVHTAHTHRTQNGCLKLSEYHFFAYFIPCTANTEHTKWHYFDSELEWCVVERWCSVVKQCTKPTKLKLVEQNEREKIACICGGGGGGSGCCSWLLCGGTRNSQFIFRSHNCYSKKFFN